ncbi:hypothetical protein GB937_007070 [Aspergillus fischeri]|nr:hypothetical protein GB937_007070 [Aspergillus fischeri]
MKVSLRHGGRKYLDTQMADGDADDSYSMPCRLDFQSIMSPWLNDMRWDAENPVSVVGVAQSVAAVQCTDSQPWLWLGLGAQIFSLHSLELGAK